MKIGIYGYGNLGRGVELAIRQNPDAELFGVFTRRDPATVKTLTGAPVYAAQNVETYWDAVAYNAYWTDAMFLEPFPQTEINKGTLVQNPGY